MTDLKALLERVEGASGPDRKIECALWATLFPHEIVMARGEYVEVGTIMPDWADDGIGLVGGKGERRILPQFTASIDAALALVEKVLPGCDWMMCPGTFTMCRNWSDDYAPTFRSHDHPKRERHESFSAWSTRRKRTHQDGPQTTPLAILAALLRSQLPNE